MFTLQTDLSRDPPGEGVKEEDGFDDALNEVQYVVVAADVGELMGEDQPELVWGEGGEGGDGDEDHRGDPTHEHRSLHEGALQEADGLFDPELSPQ